MDLCYEDLEKLHPDEVARICEWLTEKLDGFSSKIKPEAKDIEEEVCFLPCLPQVVVSRSHPTTDLFLIIGGHCSVVSDNRRVCATKGMLYSGAQWTGLTSVPLRPGGGRGGHR